MSHDSTWLNYYWLWSICTDWASSTETWSLKIAYWMATAMLFWLILVCPKSPSKEVEQIPFVELQNTWLLVRNDDGSHTACGILMHWLFSFARDFVGIKLRQECWLLDIWHSDVWNVDRLCKQRSFNTDACRCWTDLLCRPLSDVVIRKRPWMPF